MIWDMLIPNPQKRCEDSTSGPDFDAAFDRSTLPAQAELVEAYEAFFASGARRASIGAAP